MNRTDIEIMINRISQNIVTIDNGIVWFESFDSIKQLDIIRKLHYVIIESGVQNEDVELAISNSGLKKTFTPCVLLRNGDFRIQVAKLLKLPINEYRKIFILLISLFSITDGRRFEKVCQGKCNHWWHNYIKDL